MRATILSAAGAALLMLFSGCCSSCKNSTDVARAQSPATASGEWCEEDCFDEDGNCRHCWGHGCCHCRPYRVPRHMVYPPSGGDLGAGATGIVQYPYYTCKGPDCFFAEPNPVRKQ